MLWWCRDTFWDFKESCFELLEIDWILIRCYFILSSYTSITPLTTWTNGRSNVLWRTREGRLLMRISIGWGGFRNLLENEVDIHVFNWSKSNICVHNVALRLLNAWWLTSHPFDTLITLYEANIMYYLDQLAALHFLCI